VGNRKTALLAISGGLAGLLSWLVSEPFVSTIPPEHHFSVGSFYGWFAHLLFGALAGGALSLTISKQRAHWPSAWLSGALGAVLGGASVCATDALSDLIWIQIEGSNWLARGETVVPSFFWNIAVALVLAISVAIATHPTPARLKRAVSAALLAGFIAFFLRLAFGPLAGIIELWGVDMKDVLDGKVVLQRWIPFSPSRLFDFMGMGIVIGLVLGFGDTMMRRAWMRVILTSNETRDYPIEDGPNRLGSGEGLEVPLFGDRSVKPVHAIVQKEIGSYYITDVGSDSGTLLNGHPVRQAPISDGDEVTIGRYQMQFRLAATHEYYDPERPFGYIPLDDPSPAQAAQHRLIDPFGNIHNLLPGITKIGRDPAIAINVAYDLKVSPLHAEIESDERVFREILLRNNLLKSVERN